MKYPEPLVPAILLKRYKRFLADMRLKDGSVVTVHCPNPGAMLGLNEPGLEAWLLPARAKGAKLPYGLELLKVDGHFVGINANRPNAILYEALAAGEVPELAGYPSIQREVPYGRNSRIDLLLEAPDKPPFYVEIKNVHLKRGDLALFPDSVTARGAKHLDELAAEVGRGRRAAMVYLVQREDCRAFALARDIDPTYAGAFDRARKAGVEAYCRICRVSPHGIALGPPLPFAAGG